MFIHYSFVEAPYTPTHTTVLFIYMKQFAETFYKSKAWQSCRNTYIKSVGGLCEECLKHGRYKAAVEVHHKTHITPYNVNDPSITLNWDNLIALCRECHRRQHTTPKRYKVDELGRVILPPGDD